MRVIESLDNEKFEIFEMEDNFLIALSHKSEIRLSNFFEASNSLGWAVRL